MGHRDRAEWDQDYSAVCELHFRKEDFEEDRSFRTGMQRQRRRLKSGAALSVLTSVDYAMPPAHERPAKRHGIRTPLTPEAGYEGPDRCVLHE